MAHGPRSDPRWQAIRAAAIERAGWRCQAPLPDGRTCGKAMHPQCHPSRCHACATGDHIIPIALGGSLLDPANARAACWQCNDRLGRETRRIIDARKNAAQTATWLDTLLASAGAAA